jgi:hypothetical protein
MPERFGPSTAFIAQHRAVMTRHDRAD